MGYIRRCAPCPRSGHPGRDHADIGRGETYDRMKEINPDIKVLLSSGYSIDGQATDILIRYYRQRSISDPAQRTMFFMRNYYFFTI